MEPIYSDDAEANKTQPHPYGLYWQRLLRRV